MFRNLRINIFAYYFITTSLFLWILHYFLIVLETQNILLLSVVLVSLIVLSGVMISKLSIDPLELHTTNLQNLSKETLHELNLPISTIQTNLHMLKKNIQEPKDLKRIARIDSACNMLKERYNELDYMIKTQTMQELREDFALHTLIEERVAFFRALYPQVEFRLSLEASELFQDKIGLSKVIDNLLDNGIKYSQNSNILEIDLQNNQLRIRDYGCGMDEVELLKIFDTYYQSDQSVKGFGIGLSMVKRFCDTHGIALNFKSQPNIGTTVLLQFKDNEWKHTTY
ncbi:MAG: HAMP domain-containing histidine kinase [Helicobacteraceae bacterium]|nr:HAMP domain-containing histidine kinase [Helicobacteraceae bacterium]